MKTNNKTFCFALCKLIFLLLIFSSKISAQGVAINETGDMPHPTAILDIKSTLKGILFPRLTSIERDNIEAPENSLIIYNVSTKCFEFWENGAWQALSCACTTPPAQPSPVTGSEQVCQASGAEVYSVNHVQGTYYNWSFNGTGFNIISGQGTHSITAEFDGTATSGILSVTPVNACGSGTAQQKTIAILNNPNQPLAISGNIACNTGNFNLSVTPSNAGTGYTWQWYDNSNNTTPFDSGDNISVLNRTPLYYSGPFFNTTPPNGWSWHCEYSDYPSIDGEFGGSAMRLNDVGHYLTIDLGDVQPAYVSYWLNRDGADFKTLLVQHSSDGSNWTTASTLTNVNIPELGNGNGAFFQTNMPSNARYIRFYMSNCANGRYELDGITISTVNTSNIFMYYSGPFYNTTPPAGWSWSANIDADCPNMEGEGAGSAIRLNAVGHFVKLDMGAVYDHVKLSYYLNSGGAIDPALNKTLLVQYSIDNISWSTLATYTQFDIPVLGDGTEAFFNLSVPDSTRYIRFYMNECEPNSGRFELDGIRLATQLPETFCVRAEGVCDTTNCLNAELLTEKPIQHGFIYGTQQVCAGGIPEAFYGNPPAGRNKDIAYQWQQQTNCTGAWQDITGANAASYQAGPQTQTNCFRRLESNSCGSIYSQVFDEGLVGLKAWYKFDNDLYDYSGNGLHLSTNDAFVYEEESLKITENTTFTSAPTYILDTDYHTISTYFKLHTTPTSLWGHVFGYTSENADDGAPALWVVPNSNIQMYWGYDPGHIGIDPDDYSSFNLNQWYHLAGVKSGSTFTLYVNGLQVASINNVPNPKTQGCAPLLFGNNGTYDGASIILSDFRVFNRALTASEVYHVATTDITNILMVEIIQNPAAPSAGTHQTDNSQIQWNWTSIPDATGYKYNTVNNYTTATDNGAGTSFLQTGLACNTPYTLYVWVYNQCDVCNAPLTLNASTTNTVPAQPGAISGTTSPAPGTSENYSVPNVSGVNYSWSFPTGWTQTAGGNTHSVTVTVGSIAGNITVTPSNACGSGTPQTLSVTPFQSVELTLLENSINTHYGTYFSSTQRVVKTQYGLFVVYLYHQVESGSSSANGWKFLRSTDNGATFTTLYNNYYSGSTNVLCKAPEIVADADGNIYLATTMYNEQKVYLYKFAPPNFNSTSYLTSVTYGGFAPKFSFMYDNVRDRLVLMTAAYMLQFNKNTGHVIQNFQMLQPGSNAYPQYPFLAMQQSSGDYYAAWHTAHNNTQHYYNISFAVSYYVDNGATWRNYAGNAIGNTTNKITCDNTGQGTMVNLPSELSSDNTKTNGLNSFFYKGNALHFFYGGAQPGFWNKSRYTRYQWASPSGVLRIEKPNLGGSTLELDGSDGFFCSADQTQASPLYIVTHLNGNIIAIKSTDNGTTWQDYAKSSYTVPQGAQIYAVAGSRRIKDGYIYGVFTEQYSNSGPNKVYFFKIPAQ